MIEKLLEMVVQQNASDLHLRCGSPAILRINGTLYRAKMDPLSPDQLQNFLHQLTSEQQHQNFLREKELDFAFQLGSMGRFRINVFFELGAPAFAIRSTRLQIPPFTSLGLPEIIRDLSMRKRGLILVTGTTGSGKSTLLASMLEHINQNASKNIITIEDPIEFLFEDKNATFAQREIGTDALSFEYALRSCFRQDPDIIMIGEMRDVVTVESTLAAADTGHLVMSTLHTMNATETISRIISFFPPHQHDQVRIILSNVLVAIISLRLLPRADNQGLVPACEILINSPNISELILDKDKHHLITEAIADGKVQYGSRTFDQSLMDLYQQQLVTMATARQNATSPDDFQLKVSGVEGTSDRRWGQ